MHESVEKEEIYSGIKFDPTISSNLPENTFAALVDFE